jgi:hypothetical protein
MGYVYNMSLDKISETCLNKSLKGGEQRDGGGNLITNQPTPLAFLGRALMRIRTDQRRHSECLYLH